MGLWTNNCPVLDFTAAADTKHRFADVVGRMAEPLLQSADAGHGVSASGCPAERVSRHGADERAAAGGQWADVDRQQPRALTVV